MKPLSIGTFLFMVISFAPSTLASSSSLYNALGEKDGIARIVAHTLDLSFTDARTQKQFIHTKKGRLIGLITDQICALSGGPCTYKGLSMKKGHIKLGITEREFNALVEQLQTAMDKENIPYHIQNKLLAILAPMKKDIVEH